MLTRIICLIVVTVVLSACTLTSANRYPAGVSEDRVFTDDPSCQPTLIDPKFSGGDSDGEWVQRVSASAISATKVFQSQAFASACQALTLTRTNGKSVQEVCREMVCSGKISPSINFYRDANTKAIAYESAGELFINTAKAGAGAGGPGNIAHEVTHTLGYTHFTNWRFLGKNSVPYKIGYLVESLAYE